MAYSGGSGTVADPYLIATVADLQAFAAAVNGGNKYSDIYFQQTADIDATGITWIPIGTGSSAYYFSGHYDGGNHSVSYAVANGITYAAGLFGFTNGATISNINVTVSGTISTTAQIRHGGLIGRADGTTCTNCHVSGSVVNTGGYNSTYVGGLIGVSNAGTYTGCSVIGTISSASPQCGMIGYINPGSGDCTITSCYVDANITSASYGGGIVGSVTTGTVNISTCVCRGTITGGTHNGGIAGARVNNGVINITNCVALQTSIPTGSRICQLAAGTLVNNYAYSGMLIGGTAVSSTDATSSDGEDVPSDEMIKRSWWETTVGFEFGNVWYWDSEAGNPTLEEQPTIPNFAGGDGTPENPYLIETITQLYNIRNYPDKSYRQIADIEMYDDDDLNTYGWTPIGTETNPFTGSYDGDSSHLVIDIYHEFDRAGFFGVTSSAELKNIDLEIYFDIYQDGYAGGLAGHSIGGTITNCYCGNYGYGKDNVGGLVGVSSSTITSCGTIGRIRTQINDYPTEYVGGIAGRNEGTIQNCFSNVSIEEYQTATATRNAGGIAGRNEGTIQNCVFAGKIYSAGITGTCHRIVATNTGLLSSNYAWIGSTVMGNSVSGGNLTDEDGLDVATADFTQEWWENLGFVFDFQPWYYSHSTTGVSYPKTKYYYWCYFEVGMNPSSGYSPVTVSLDFTSDATITSVTYEIAYGDEPNTWIPIASGDTATVTVTVPGTHTIRATAVIELDVVTKTRTITVGMIFSGGHGTAEIPFLISTVDDLQQLAINTNAGNSYNRAYFKQTRDIDLSGINWVPIGNLYDNMFEGSYDGCYHTINNLHIDIHGGDCAGLFGYVMTNGGIKNLRLTNVNIFADGPVGGVAGYISGYISNVCVSGSITGTNGYVGGIIGDGLPTINDCYSSGIITGAGYVGGIVGGIWGLASWELLIANCYSTCSIVTDNPTQNIGGIFGASRVRNPTISSVVALNSSIPSTAFRVARAPATNSYALSTLAQSNPTINVPDVTPEVAEAQSFYEDTLGWDFDTIWKMDKNQSPYPILRNLPAEPENPDPENPDPDEPIPIANEDCRGIYPITVPAVFSGYRGSRIIIQQR